jgi:hypothetical protein
MRYFLVFIMCAFSGCHLSNYVSNDYVKVYSMRSDFQHTFFTVRADYFSEWNGSAIDIGFEEYQKTILDLKTHLMNLSMVKNDKKKIVDEILSRFHKYQFQIVGFIENTGEKFIIIQTYEPSEFIPSSYKYWVSIDDGGLDNLRIRRNTKTAAFSIKYSDGIVPGGYLEDNQ